MTRGVTRKRTGSRPIVVSASISWLTRIVPISAANAAPVRPASRIAVISGPSSRTIAEADQVGDEDLGAESLHRHRRLERQDHARAGTRSARRSAARRRRRARTISQTSRQRIVDGWRIARKRARRIACPTNSTCVRMSRRRSRRCCADLLDRGRRCGSGSRSCSSTCGSNCRSSAANAGSRLATSTGALRGWRRRSTSSAMPAPSQ